MSQPALKAAIKASMVANIPSPTSAQMAAFDTTAGAIATAVITCVSSLTITYTTGLIAPSGGGPVTGVLTGVVIT